MDVSLDIMFALYRSMLEFNVVTEPDNLLHIRKYPNILSLK